jgi:hypothetical protein
VPNDDVFGYYITCPTSANTVPNHKAINGCNGMLPRRDIGKAMIRRS